MFFSNSGNTRSVIFGACCITLLVAACSGPANTPDFDRIENRINSLVEGFAGDAGIYVKHVPSGREFGVNADSLFPTASMVKVPIMVRIVEMVDQGQFDYDSLFVFEDRLYYPGTDVVGAMKPGEGISLRKLIFLSISFSDNTASLWLQELAGTGAGVNDKMARLGLEHTRVNSRTDGRQEAFRQYGWGQTTPREMTQLMEMIHDGQILSPQRSEEMYRFMSKTLWDDTALAVIPQNVNVASKQGSVGASKSEVVYVNAPSGDYLFTVVTKNQQDRGYQPDNEGVVFIREVSRVLWEELGMR
jgi:beta-lactamase class A